MSAFPQVFCPQCGTRNDASARFCNSCGRSLQDLRADDATANPVTAGDQEERTSALLADDRLPVGEGLDRVPGGERVLWEGRPSLLWSPRTALTQRYKLTNHRLIVTFGFIGRRTEEIDLFRVNDVGVKQHPLERVTGIGDVYISSADQSSPIRYLHNVKSPDEVKDLLREFSHQERRRRRVLLREEF